MQALLFSDLTFKKAWRRVVAQLIDLALVWLITMSVIMITRTVLQAKGMFVWLYLLVFDVYSVLFDMFRQGTPGKLMLGLKVVCTSTIRPVILTALYRNLLKAVSILILVDSYMLIMGRQGFHNRMVDCQVVSMTEGA